MAGLAGILDKQHFKAMGFRKDLALALGIVGILVILILPLPTYFIDFFLALSLTFSVLVLMTAIFIEKVLQFTSFPFVLLITTMFRLAMNLATTRVILSEGYRGASAAGHVIEAFGGFVMGGNFVIGVIVFVILVLVNFMVITKGSTRIAEVAARFTLDAMPGKQMAIDADLSSGLIDENEARRRREEMSQESSFFGAMDGASKFVRGDAVAGLIITAINIIAGLIIGMAQRGMTFSAASETFMRLTVGDGLVTQIPALIISVAAGIMVSKGGMTQATEKVLFGQLAFYPKALGMSSFLAASLALLPGTPAIPFLLLAGLSGSAAWYINKTQETVKKKLEAQALEEDKETGAAAAAAEEVLTSAPKLDQIGLSLGYGLFGLVQENPGHNLLDQIKFLRRNLARELGFIMPSLRIRDAMQLPANQYVVYIKEIEAGRGELKPNMLLAMNFNGSVDIPGEKTADPAFGQPAVWIDPMYREDAMFKGFTVAEPVAVIATHLIEIIKANMPDLLSFSETQKLLDELSKDQSKLVADLVPSRISVGGVQRVLQNLLAEQVSIRDLPTVLEGIADGVAVSHSPDMITEHVRTRLSRQISAAHSDENGIIHMVVMSPQWVQIFGESTVGSGDDKQAALSPTDVQKFVIDLRKVFADAASQGISAVLVTPPVMRLHVRRIVERMHAQITVLSQSEIHPKFKLKTVGSL